MYQTLSSVCFFEAHEMSITQPSLTKYQTLSSVCFFEAASVRCDRGYFSDRVPDAFERLLL